MPQPSTSSTKTWISVLILVVLGLHAVPVVSYQGVGQTRWPFLAWAMYARAYKKGPIETMDRRIVGTTASGAEFEINSGIVGLSRPTLRTLYMNPMNKGDTAAAQALLSRLNQDRSDPILEVRLEGTRYTLADTGVVTEPLPVATYRAPGGAGR